MTKDTDFNSNTMRFFFFSFLHNKCAPIFSISNTNMHILFGRIRTYLRSTGRIPPFRNSALILQIDITFFQSKKKPCEKYRTEYQFIRTQFRPQNKRIRIQSHEKIRKEYNVIQM